MANYLKPRAQDIAMQRKLIALDKKHGYKSLLMQDINTLCMMINRYNKEEQPKGYYVDALKTMQNMFGF